MLRKDADTDLETVNQAWKAAGHQGTISQSYLGKVKTMLGLTRPRGGSRSEKSSPKGSQAENAPKRSHVTEEVRSPENGPMASELGPSPAETSETEGRNRALEVLEADIDRLLFRIMDLGGLEEAEQALRRARRIVSREIL